MFYNKFLRINGLHAVGTIGACIKRPMICNVARAMRYMC